MLPQGWNERHEASIGIPLPNGAKFFSTPGHGFLQVDINKLPAQVSPYDYTYSHFVLLEEDCSMTMWLAEMGLIPMEDYIRRMLLETPRQPVGKFRNPTKPYATCALCYKHIFSKKDTHRRDGFYYHNKCWGDFRKKWFNENPLRNPTVKDRLEIIANSSQSTDSDSRWMQNVLHAMGFPSAVVVLGIVYLEGKGTIEAPPMSINSAARMILKVASEKGANPRKSKKYLTAPWIDYYLPWYTDYTAKSLNDAMMAIHMKGHEMSSQEVDYYMRPKSLGGLGYGVPKARRAIEEDTDYVRKPHLKSWNPIETCAFCGKPFRSLKTAHLDPVTHLFYHGECWRAVKKMAGRRPF